MRLCAVKGMLNICFHLTMWIRNLSWCRLPGICVVNVIISASLETSLLLWRTAEQPQAWWRTEQSRAITWCCVERFFLTCAQRCINELLYLFDVCFFESWAASCRPCRRCCPSSGCAPAAHRCQAESSGRSGSLPSMFWDLACLCRDGTDLKGTNTDLTESDIFRYLDCFGHIGTKFFLVLLQLCHNNYGCSFKDHRNKLMEQTEFLLNL